MDHERFAAIILSKQIGPDAAARKLNIPERTLKAWVAGFRYPQGAELCISSAAIIADSFDRASWDCLGLSLDKADEAPFNHLMKAAIDAQSIARTIRGEPGVITQHQQAAPKLDFSKLTLDECNELIRLLDIATATGTTPSVEAERREPAVSIEPSSVRAEGVADPQPGP